MSVWSEVSYLVLKLCNAWTLAPYHTQSAMHVVFISKYKHTMVWLILIIEDKSNKNINDALFTV